MNYTSQYEFTIIVPVYNEADNIEALGKRLKEFLPLSIYRACVLFVNDASNDGGLEMIKDICKRCNHFFYISFKENCGLSAALKAGIDFSESKYIGYIDADLQTIPEDFNMLLLYAKNYPLVTGVRSDRQDSYFKKLQSKIGNGFRRMVTKDGAVDTGCPLKVIQKEYAKRIPLFTGMHRFIPALILLQRGGRYKEVSVRHFPRVAGKSKYRLSNRMLSSFRDCFAYQWMAHRYINYQINDKNI